LKTVQTDGFARFNLSFWHGEDSRPQCFGHIARAQKRQGNDAAGKAVPFDADFRQAVIEEEQLDKQRRVARKFDITAGEKVKRPDAVSRYHRHGQADGQG
jgi:hypothetical protein